MKTIFHLSFPVRDLDEAIGFYTVHLGARMGRRTEEFADLFLFGAQVTLQNDPQSVIASASRTRHFGATLGWDDWKEMAYRLMHESFVKEGLRMTHCFEPNEQAKIMLADPSDNLIELKTYKNPDKVLGARASQ